MGADLETYDCLIVGAGISGMLAATRIQQAGLKVCILDKGRGLGGRMATRRRAKAVFDHGAQFFTIRDPRFESLVAGWTRLGLVRSWYHLPASGPHYRVEGGMTSIAKHLARPLEIHRRTLIEKVVRSGDGWSLRAGDRKAFHSTSLLLTAPVPQSLALLDTGSIPLEPTVRSDLERIRYHRCIAALAVLAGPSALTQYGGAIKLEDEPVQWITDNHRKGISPESPAATIHSTPDFADNYWDADDSELLPLLLEAAQQYLQTEVISCESHRWGFSQPICGFRDESYFDPDRRLAIAGDGFAGGRIEGAAISGLSAAQELIDHCPTRG